MPDQTRHCALPIQRAGSPFQPVTHWFAKNSNATLVVRHCKNARIYRVNTCNRQGFRVYSCPDKRFHMIKCVSLGWNLWSASNFNVTTPTSSKPSVAGLSQKFHIDHNRYKPRKRVAIFNFFCFIDKRIIPKLIYYINNIPEAVVALPQTLGYVVYRK